jgi:uncharacterized protein YidB (DUF937 family)
MSNEEKSLVEYVQNLVTYIKKTDIVATDMLTRAEGLTGAVSTFKLVLEILNMMKDKDVQESEDSSTARGEPTTLSGGALGFAITEKLLKKITSQKGLEQKLQVTISELSKVWPFLSKNLTLISQLVVHYSVNIMRAHALVKSGNIEVSASLVEAKGDQDHDLISKNSAAIKSINDLTASAVTYKKSLQNTVEDCQDDLEKAIKILNALYEELTKKKSPATVPGEEKVEQEVKEIQRKTTERSYEMMKKYFNIILENINEILMFLNKNNELPELVPEHLLH